MQTIDEILKDYAGTFLYEEEGITDRITIDLNGLRREVTTNNRPKEDFYSAPEDFPHETEHPNGQPIYQANSKGTFGLRDITAKSVIGYHKNDKGNIVEREYYRLINK